ncbi:MAG: LuxR C-terminal-related transcriptional regulator [Hyphomicrobiaceae bacterium]
MLRLLSAAPQADFADLQASFMSYAGGVERLSSPTEVLNELHAITMNGLSLSVLGAVRMPMKSENWDSLEIGRSAFLHEDVPKGWWEEHSALARGKFRPVLSLASSGMAALTWTEVRRMVQPIGVDLWSNDLALKHGMRDGLTCPVGGRWVIAFWSRKVLSNLLTQPARIMIVAAASFAALRLEQLAGPDPKRIDARCRLTPRELAVLRLVSMGAQSAEVARALELGEETVRTHLKKAQAKLGVRSRTQAVAEALRQCLIP